MHFRPDIMLIIETGLHYMIERTVYELLNELVGLNQWWQHRNVLYVLYEEVL